MPTLKGIEASLTYVQCFLYLVSSSIWKHLISLSLSEKAIHKAVYICKQCAHLVFLHCKYAIRIDTYACERTYRCRAGSAVNSVTSDHEESMSEGGSKKSQVLPRVYFAPPFIARYI